MNLDTVYFDIAIVERPRLSRLHLTGIRKGGKLKTCKKAE